MADIRSKIYEIYALEQLALKESPIHTLHPLVKLLSTMVYVLCVISFDRYEITSLLIFILYPVLMAKMAKIPVVLIFQRSLVALPFCLFVGFTGLFFESAAMAYVGPVAISYGTAAFLALLVRSLLCVASVLVLIATTPFDALARALRRLYVPALFVSLLEMTYRYIGVLLEEASSLYTAYRLRSSGGRGVQPAHMGSLIGQLFFRSYDRAERVYQAMQCRGYTLQPLPLEKRSFSKADFLFLFLVCGSSLLFRMMPFACLWKQVILC